MNRDRVVTIAIISSYAIFIALSWIFGFGPGREITHNFAFFSLDMLKVLPCAFILNGLFEIWVKRETIERHFGEKSGLEDICGGYFWQAPQLVVCM